MDTRSRKKKENEIAVFVDFPSLFIRVFTTDQCIHVSLGYLKGLTNEILPVLSLVEVETKLFSRVLPKVHLHNLLLIVQVSTER